MSNNAPTLVYACGDKLVDLTGAVHPPVHTILLVHIVIHVQVHVVPVLEQIVKATLITKLYVAEDDLFLSTGHCHSDTPQEHDTNGPLVHFVALTEWLATGCESKHL